jgi:hypothetical protein
MNPKRPFFDGMVRDERGAALAMILLIGSVLVVLTGVIVTRGVRQVGNTAGDADWEQSLNVAEAGMEYAINALNGDGGFTTGETVPAFADRSEERDWAITEAIDHAVVATPEGEFAIVVPANEDVIFSIGYTPSRDAVNVRTRVVRREYEIVRYVAVNGFLIGGDADIAANTLIDDPAGEDAHVHANGSLDLGNNVTVDGCATSSETVIPAEGDCPESPVAPALIPTIRVRPYYQFATYALCPDGTVRGGPAHASKADPTPATPCDPGDTVINGMNLKYTANKKTWAQKTQYLDTPGIYYVYQGNWDGKIGKSGDRGEVMLLAEAGSHSCTMPSGGDVWLSGGSDFEYHSSVAQYETAIIAEGDLVYRGSATVIGAVIAREQVDYAGSPDSWGPVLASDECHTPGSPVSVSETQGGAVIKFGGQLETLFVSGVLPVNWDEL